MCTKETTTAGQQCQSPFIQFQGSAPLLSSRLLRTPDDFRPPQSTSSPSPELSTDFAAAEVFVYSRLDDQFVAAQNVVKGNRFLAAMIEFLVGIPGRCGSRRTCQSALTISLARRRGSI
jgi:hypothetical protein